MVPLLRQGPVVPGQSHARGAGGRRTRKILLLVQDSCTRQVWLRNLLCRLPAQLERKSPGVRTPCLSTQPRIPARPAATAQLDPKNSTGRGGKGPWDPLGHCPSVKWGWLHCLLCLANGSKCLPKTIFISEVSFIVPLTRCLTPNKIRLHILTQATQLTRFLAFPARKQMNKELVRGRAGNEHTARLEFTSVFLTKAIDDVYTLLACHLVSLAKCCGCWIIPKQGVLEPHPLDPGVE